MSKKLCVSLTCALDNPDRATVAFVVANASVASDTATMVFLSTEGVRLAESGAAEGVHEDGFAPLGELIGNFVKAGGQIFVCSPCFKKRGLSEDKLLEGATIVGGASLVEYLTAGDGAACVTY
ncbi:MAG: DsrE family protein [Candidatus Melainabacteria bacterium]|nr:DsrE family protein [Candidatus Melainabacteria bacterium]